jgi:LAO/AO transport system kinase
VLVVNKADRPDSQAAVRDLRAMVALSASAWKPPVVTTIATANEGIDELLRQLDRHEAWLDGSGERSRRRLARARAEVTALALARVARRLAVPDALAARVADGELGPHQAVEELLVTAGIAQS